MTEAPESDGEPDVVLRGHSARVTGVRALDAKASKVLSASQIGGFCSGTSSRATAERSRSHLRPSAARGCRDGVAVVGLLDGSVEGYDLEDGARVFRLEDAHEGAVRSVHFGDDGFSPRRQRRGPRGRLLCTGGADGVVKCYTMRGGADGEPLQPQKVDGCPLEAEDVPIHFRVEAIRSPRAPGPRRRRCRGAGGRHEARVCLHRRERAVLTADGRATLCARWSFQAHHVAPTSRGTAPSERWNGRSSSSATSRAKYRVGPAAPFDGRVHAAISLAFKYYAVTSFPSRAPSPAP